MATQDWKALQAQFEHDHAKYGTGAKEWCEAKGLNYSSARRYIKVRKTAQKKTAHSQTAQPVRKSTAQKKARKNVSKDKSNKPSAPAKTPPKRHMVESERDEGGRFKPGHTVSVGNAGNTNVPVNAFEVGNQAARKGGIYARYFPEQKQHMFDLSQIATLNDELMLTRARLQSGIEYLGKIHADMENASSLDERIALYESFTRVNTQLDTLTGRIESMTRTLSSLGIDAVNKDKIVADTSRLRSATRKLTLEADRLAKEGKADDTPISQMLDDLQDSGTGGLMSK
ncbi:hypothetical protein [Salinivibrio sp. YCSC6]|uniref:hypothetical protein n=1 Tax=Salinivibrio sp. YCSC6 TaxID=2003370 RepID=UPI000BBBB679|nr:hypothetical protein [Salinivibrio sp. YCSC6]PCE67541.1 hypothetical protein B6G00_04115 [Salinivibrio sp. YCSC6]QCF35552.1 hypothetical protein E8E00_04835 [Salinivibrio sp. YCSC6]